MAQGARVHSFDALRSFRAALYKFAEIAEVALTDAEGETQRVMGWLERDQQSYWQFQMRKRQEDVAKCKEAVRMKKLFKGADGRPASAVDEEKALAKAMKRLADGERKCKAVMSWSRKLPKDIMLFKGSVQRLATALQSDVPTAGSQLSRLVATLEAYAAMQGPAGGLGGDDKLVTSSIGAAALSMTRGGADAVGARSPWARLRSKTPAADAREKASGTAIPAELRAAKLATSELEAVLAISAERTAVDPQSRVVLAANLGAAPQIYLERLDIAFPGDSGWYIGRADDVATEAGGSITVSELLNARGDLVDLLTLPKGYLAVLDGGGVVSVLGQRDEELWKAPAAAAEAPQPAATEPATPAPTT
jgi:hypothetical protein